MKFNANKIDVSWVEAKYIVEYKEPKSPYVVDDPVCTVDDGKAVLYFPIWGHVRDASGKIIPCVKIELPVRNGPMDGRRIGDELEVKILGLVKLGPGVWKIDPVVVTPVFKAYVIIKDVPDPAPWELSSKVNMFPQECFNG